MTLRSISRFFFTAAAAAAIIGIKQGDWLVISLFCGMPLFIVGMMIGMYADDIDHKDDPNWSTTNEAIVGAIIIHLAKRAARNDK